MHLPDLVALDTLLAVAVFFGAGVAVARGRARFKIAAPATSGHPDFDRLFRTQMNTLEALALFLPSLWVAALHADRLLVGGIGLAWVVGRTWYAIAYANDAKKRGPGFVIGMIATVALWLIAAWSLVVAAMAG